MKRIFLILLIFSFIAQSAIAFSWHKYEDQKKPPKWVFEDGISTGKERDILSEHGAFFVRSNHEDDEVFAMMRAADAGYYSKSLVYMVVYIVNPVDMMFFNMTGANEVNKNFGFKYHNKWNIWKNPTNNPPNEANLIMSEIFDIFDLDVPDFDFSSNHVIGCIIYLGKQNQRFRVDVFESNLDFNGQSDFSGDWGKEYTGTAIHALFGYVGSMAGISLNDRIHEVLNFCWSRKSSFWIGAVFDKEKFTHNVNYPGNRWMTDLLNNSDWFNEY